MASIGEAPAVFLQEIYDQIIAKQALGRVGRTDKAVREKAVRDTAFPCLEKLDASHDWQLSWRVICDSAKDGDPAYVTMPYLKVLLDAARFYESKASVPALLLKAVRRPELKRLHGDIARMLLQATEQDKGAVEALTLAREMVRERPDSEAGLAAFRYACDALERLKGGQGSFRIPRRMRSDAGERSRPGSRQGSTGCSLHGPEGYRDCRVLVLRRG